MKHVGIFLTLVIFISFSTLPKIFSFPVESTPQNSQDQPQRQLAMKTSKEIGIDRVNDTNENAGQPLAVISEQGGTYEDWGNERNKRHVHLDIGLGHHHGYGHHHLPLLNHGFGFHDHHGHYDHHHHYDDYHHHHHH